MKTDSFSSAETLTESSTALRVDGRHVGIEFDTATGNLLSIRRLSDDALIYHGDSSHGIRICCGGEPPRFLSRGGVQTWKLLVDTPPEGSVCVGEDTVFLGCEQTDTGGALELRILQQSGTLRMTTVYRLYKRDPILAFDFEVQNLGDEDLSVHFLSKSWGDWAFTEDRCIWKTDKGNFQTQALNCGGSAVFWRASEGDWWVWDVLPEPRKSMDCKLLMGGWLKAGGPSMSGGGFHIGLSEHQGWRSADVAQKWCTTQHMKPLPGCDWMDGANLLETFIGFRNVVGNDTVPKPCKHEPYPTTQDLRADLPRLREFGYDVLYLMPRQPYPGYTTHSLSNAAEQYGDGPGTELAFQELVKEAHALGMRVIVDVVLHGGMDHTSIANNMRYTELIGPGNIGSNNDLVHRDYLLANAPKEHPFWETNPEWFSLIEADECHMGYTKFFDLRHPGFQDYFVTSLSSMIAEYDIDGFRFDAPWWTPTAYRWLEEAGYRASWCVGASQELISYLYQTTREVKADALFFMESSDPFTCQTAHMQYPYDVQRVVFVQMHKDEINARQAREGLAYLRKIRLPEMRTAYWMVDSHDSVWGYLPKEKWLRDFVGMPKTKACCVLMATLGDAIMAYNWSEQGMEDLFSQLLHLRQENLVLRKGRCNELAVECSHDSVFPVWRSLGSEWVMPVINFSNELVTVELDLPLANLDCDCVDLLESGRRFQVKGSRIVLELEPYGYTVLSPA